MTTLNALEMRKDEASGKQWTLLCSSRNDPGLNQSKLLKDI